jgi:hypothetical protein
MKNCSQQFVLAQEIHESLLKIRKVHPLPENYELFNALNENCKEKSGIDIYFKLNPKIP